LSVRRPTCFVTLDLPFPVNHRLWGRGIAGYQTITLESVLEVAANDIRWRPSDRARRWLLDVVSAQMEELGLERLLVRLTLKGNFIWQKNAPEIYLDGEALGTPENAAPHNLRLPSGDDRSGGDFEMWFWLERDGPPPPPSGEIRWAIYGVDGIDSLDPVSANDSPDKTIIDLLYAGLVRLDENLQVIPDLAERWDVSEDGLVYTFYLRSNSAFFDGSPLTAHDVEFSLERARDEANGWSGPVYLSNIAGIEAIDDLEVRVELQQPSRFFLHQLTTAPAKIVSRQMVETGDEDWDLSGVTSGAFGVPRWQRGTEIIELEQNPGYWDPAAVERVILFLTAHRVRAQQMYSGEDMVIVDVVGGLQNDVTLGPDGSVILGGWVPPVSPTSGLRYLGFNTTREPFNVPEVRYALALALDRRTLANKVLGGSVNLAQSISPPGIATFDCDLQVLGPDPDLPKAEALLSEAGFERQDQTWIDFNGNRLHVDLFYAFDGDEGDNTKVVEVISDMWMNFGVSVNLEAVPNVRAFSEMLHKMFESPEDSPIEAYYSFWGADYPDPQNVLSQHLHSVEQLDTGPSPNRAHNNGHYENEQFDEWVEQGDAGALDQASLDAYCQAEELALEEGARVPLFFPEPRVLVRDGIEGLVVTGQGIIIPDFSALKNTAGGE
jgi:oligopeptide transport system substrate-binding protein